MDDSAVNAHPSRKAHAHVIVGEPDSMTPLGTKGVGELAITGMAAAIADAVHHATGARIRLLPISIEKVLAHEAASARRDGA
jgi:CO/xanthine dehydrogenase Mo-binding subunit